MWKARIVAWLTIVCMVSVAAPAASQERDSGDPAVIGAQSATVLAHGVGGAMGIVMGAAIAFEICPILSSGCTPGKEAAMYAVVAAGALLLGSTVGSAVTWAVGRHAMDSPGRFLPTWAGGAAGTAVGAIPLFLWPWLTDAESNASFVVPFVAAAVLGTAGAIIGFHASF